MWPFTKPVDKKHCHLLLNKNGGGGYAFPAGHTAKFVKDNRCLVYNRDGVVVAEFNPYVIDSYLYNITIFSNSLLKEVS